MDRPDALIFDMDGTLWDNVDSYVACWNRAFEKKNISTKLSRIDLLHLMGKDAMYILKELLPTLSRDEHFAVFEEVNRQYAIMGPQYAKLYPYVKEGLYKLSAAYRLFMLSNCEKNGIRHFMEFSETESFFVDYMEWGMNEMPKSHNLKLLSAKYHLRHPVYVGDTESDSRESAKAKIPFVYAAYGFGETADYAIRFDSFQALTNYFLQL